MKGVDCFSAYYSPARKGLQAYLGKYIDNYLSKYNKCKRRIGPACGWDLCTTEETDRLPAYSYPCAHGQGCMFLSRPANRQIVHGNIPLCKVNTRCRIHIFCRTKLFDRTCRVPTCTRDAVVKFYRYITAKACVHGKRCSSGKFYTSGQNKKGTRAWSVNEDLIAEMS